MNAREAGNHSESRKFSNRYRLEYGRGLEAVLHCLRESSGERRSANAKELESDPDSFRRRVRACIGWPLTQPRGGVLDVRRQRVATDALGEIWRIQIEIMEDVWFYGVLFLKDPTAKRPLVLAQHGGGGTPELCSGFYGNDSVNYNDMTQRLRRRDVNVFCPQLYMWKRSIFGRGVQDRWALDDKLKQFGSSITAIEIDALEKCIDWLCEQPFVDAGRIGMAGLSYGGFYSLLMAALDTRIRAALSSCYFNDRTQQHFPDWEWMDSGNLFLDAELAALTFPRKLWIEVGKNDELFPYSGALKEYNRLLDSYPGLAGNIRFEAFDGVHEFCKADDGIDFLMEALLGEPQSGSRRDEGAS